MKTMSENGKTTVQAASASGMNIRREAWIQLGFLSAQFMLGMAVNVIGRPFETGGAHHTASVVLLWVHVGVGVGLIAGAVMAIRAARGGGKQPLQLALSGALLICLTFIAGVLTVTTKNHYWESHWLSYIMAAGFIASFLVYASLLVRAQSLLPAARATELIQVRSPRRASRT